MPDFIIRASSRSVGYCDFHQASYSGSSGRLREGTLKLAVRWNTMSRAASLAITGIDWIADDPVPITATRWPVKSTPSCGQAPV